MKVIKTLILTTAFILVSGCEVSMAPSEHWGQWFNTQPDTKYYEYLAEDLVENLVEDSREYEINRVTVIDLVNEEGVSPILGEYLSSRLIEVITRNRYFRVAQKGEVKRVMNQMHLKASYSYTEDEIKHLGDALKSQAILTGKLTDLGTNLDVHLTLTDVLSGEVIASATENLTRTKFAVEMFRQH